MQQTPPLFCRANLNLFTQAGDDLLTKRDLSLNEALTYRFQQTITGTTTSKLAFVLALCLPYIIASAAFYRSLCACFPTLAAAVLCLSIPVWDKYISMG